MAAIKGLEIYSRIPDVEQYQKYSSASVPAAGTMVYIKTEDSISSEELQGNLQKELDNANQQINRLNKLLSSDFAKKAPDEVVEKEKAKLETFEQTAHKIEDQLKTLQ